LIVVFDASILIYVIDEQAKPPVDPTTGKPVDSCYERVTHLLESLQQQNAKIVIPTPALAEVLVRAAKGGPEFLRILSSSRHFRIAAFDERAAVEFAARQAERIVGIGRAPPTTRAKAKFDDQIVAIAAVEGATTIYSDDEDIARLAESRFEVIKIAAIPLPPEAAQGKLPFGTDEQGGSKPQP
jgi:predicted nucleic acid-binding protein